MKKSGKTEVYLPTKEEKLAFKKALVPVHQKMEGRIGKDLIQSIYKRNRLRSREAVISGQPRAG